MPDRCARPGTSHPLVSLRVIADAHDPSRAFTVRQPPDPAAKPRVLALSYCKSILPAFRCFFHFSCIDYYGPRSPDMTYDRLLTFLIDCSFLALTAYHEIQVSFHENRRNRACRPDQTPTGRHHPPQPNSQRRDRINAAGASPSCRVRSDRTKRGCRSSCVLVEDMLLCCVRARAVALRRQPDGARRDAMPRSLLRCTRISLNQWAAERSWRRRTTVCLDLRHYQSPSRLRRGNGG